jgi:predicted DNA-binding protein
MTRKRPPPRSTTLEPPPSASARAVVQSAILTMRLPAELHERLDAAVDRLAEAGTPRTRSDLIRWAIERLLTDLEAHRG